MSATRASGESTGWQADEDRAAAGRRRRSSSSAASRSGGRRCGPSRARGRAPRASARARACGGSWSMARCLAVAMSQAPGLSGMPDSGQLLERGDERVLGQVLCEADVAHHAGQAGDEPGRLDPPHGVDGAMGGRGSHQDCRRSARAGAPPAPRSSGVTAGPKSSISNTGRISISEVSPVGFGQRFGPTRSLHRATSPATTSSRR